VSSQIIKKSSYDHDNEYGFGLWIRFLGKITSLKYIARVTDLNIQIDSNSFYFNSEKLAHQDDLEGKWYYFYFCYKSTRAVAWVYDE